MTGTRILLGILSLAVLATPALAAQEQPAPSCEQWNTRAYFEAASVEAVTACLAAGANTETRDEIGGTPLHVAAVENGNPAVIEALLAAGANLEARDEDGNTPLHVAAQNENLAVIQALIDAGADPKVRGEDGLTPLHRAARREKSAVVQVLLAAGAELEVRDKDGNTPLHWAANRNNTGAATQALLAAGANMEARDEEGNTPLHVAAQYVNDYVFGDEEPHAGEAIEALLAAGAAAAARNAAGRTPWDLAQANEALKGSGAYWRLNDARRTPAGGRPSTAGPGGGSAGAPAGTVGAGASGGQCEIPGYPTPPGGVANVGLSWCPASVDIQVRAFALQAAGAQCAMATGNSSTPEQIQARRQEIKAACDRLAALGTRLDGPNSGASCRCPAGFGP